MIYNDLNGNGAQDAGEPGLGGRTVYLDQNQDGIPDNGELTTVTASDGSFSFTGLAPGTYHVAQVLPSGWQQTSPVNGPTRDVTLGTTASTTTFTFDDLATTTDKTLPAYHSNGFTFNTNVNQPTIFRTPGSTDTGWYAGSASLESQWAPATISLTKDDGTAFSPKSIDLAPIATTYYALTVTFTGTHADGTSVSQVITIPPKVPLAFQTFALNGFDNITKLSWGFTGSPPNDYEQFDNVVVQTGVPQSVSGVMFGAKATVNQAPVATNDAFKTNENQSLSAAAPGVLSNDNDPDGDPLTATLVSGPAHGTVTLNANGSFTYTPALYYYGADSFTYQASDGTLTSNVATVNLTVNHVPQPPVATADSYTVNKGTALVVAAPGVLGNDTDPEGNALTAVLVTGPNNGSVTLNPDGSFTYTPNGLYLGPDNFTYKATDGTLSSNVAVVSLNVTGPDDPPVANNDYYRSPINGNLTVSAPGVLGNDTDPNGKNQSFHAVLVSGPLNGNLTFNSDGSFNYTPLAGFHGTDSFQYKANDGTLDSNVATVTLTVAGNPVATADTYTTNENTPLTVAAPGILGNDTDPNGLALTPVVTSSTVNGMLKVNPDGSFSYTPKANFYGTDTFNYYVTDGTYSSTYVTDTITVNHVNQPPVANDDSYSVAENGTLTAAAGVTSVHMVSDPGDWVGQGQTYDFSPSNATITADVMSGGVYTNTVEVSVTSGNEWWYLRFVAPNNARLVPGVYANASRWPFEPAGTPGMDVSGDGRGSNTSVDSFTVYQALYDPSGKITAFAADFTQHSEGATPALNGRVMFDSSLNKPEGVLFNDTDPDPNTTLTANLVAGPAHGSVSLNADGSFSYTPTAGYFGADSFTYKANDGQLDSNVATVHLTVNGLPVAASSSVSTSVLTPVPVPLSASDPDGEALTYTILSGPSHGTLSGTAPNLTYTPAAGFSGTDSLTFKANDGSLDSNVATVTIAVNKLTPTVTWASPADITYGTALDGTQLDASASIPGTFAYSPAAGTVLGAGLGQTLSATFTPTDTADYNSVTATTTINVNQATPTVTWANPADITFGTALGGAQLDASASVPGSFVYTPAAGTVLGAGQGQVLSVQFTPTDSTDYANVTATATINVGKATPVIAWANPADITYGTALGAAQLDATSTVAGKFTYAPTAGVVLGAGSGQVLSASFTPADTADYNAVSASTTINVQQATPALTWPSPADITFGTALDGTQLDASASVPGTFAYSPAAGTVLGAGSGQTLSVTFTPTDTTDYTAVSGTTTINVAKATPMVAWASPADITYGTALDATQLDASASVPGTFNYTPVAGTVLGAGLGQTLSATFTPTDTADYNSVTASTTINVNQATPTVTWANPADITYGTALGGAQLDASASVPGSFVYTPAAGTVLGAGQGQVLSVQFIPTDSTDYASATATATINVRKATPVVTWASPADITFGTALGATQLDATSPAPGTFSYSPAAGVVLGAGSGQTLSATFTPSDAVDYNPVTATTTINVQKATPVVTWAGPADIAYGTALGSTQLDATASVPGSFAYSPAAGTVLHAGSGQRLAVSFTPTDSADYNPVTASTTINVGKATPAITWASPADITYGTTLGAAQLDASTSVAGTFQYTPAAGTVLHAGLAQTLSATFTPSDAADYKAVSASTTINVQKATPVITWATPAGITYGTALGSTQLNATASVPGSFAYSPGAGVVPHAGNVTLSAVFSPTDSTDYTSASASTVLNVAKAHLVVAANSADMGHGGSVPALAYQLSGFVNGDTSKVVSGTAVLSTTATSSSAAGRYPITVSNGSLSAADYDFTPANGTLTVHPKVVDVRVQWGSRTMSLLGLGRDLPFINIKAVDVVFSDDVNVARSDLSLTSTATSGHTYTFSGFSYNASSHDATWTLSSSLPADRLSLALDSLFGARVDPTISVWNASPVSFSVLPGDYDGDGVVTNQDVSGVQSQESSRTPAVWADLNGDNVVNSTDANAAKSRRGTRLP